MKKILALGLTLILAMGLTGCSKGAEFAPTETGIYIAKDRTVKSAEIDSFDNSKFDTPRYSDTELIAFVEDAVRTYNVGKTGQNNCRMEELADQKDATLPVAIEKLAVEDKVATLILDYETFRDYLDFNGTTDAVPVQNLIVGSVADGVNSGLTFEGMNKVEKGAVIGAADPAEIAEDVKYTLVAVTGKTPVSVEGTIVYLSSELTFVDEHSAVCSGGTQYIIFK